MLCYALNAFLQSSFSRNSLLTIILSANHKLRFNQFQLGCLTCAAMLMQKFIGNFERSFFVYASLTLNVRFNFFFGKRVSWRVSAEIAILVVTTFTHRKLFAIYCMFTSQNLKHKICDLSSNQQQYFLFVCLYLQSFRSFGKV